MRVIAVALTAVLVMSTTGRPVGSQSLPDGYMSESQSSAILDKTLHIHLDPDLTGLSTGERVVVDKLISVGEIFQRLHENARHIQAREAYDSLLALDAALGSPRATKNLISLYYMFKGPIARTLDNSRAPFLPVADKPAGGGLYPWGVDREQFDAYLDDHPDSRGRLLAIRTVVRRIVPERLRSDLSVLDAYPVLDALHPGLRDRLERLEDGPVEGGFYAVPYSVAFAPDLVAAYHLLMEAGDAIDEEDEDFAGYLRNRARDLICDDYESGDASWVTGRFNHLNAEIGSYEVYDDDLYGVKSHFALSVLLRIGEESDALRRAIRGIQSFENSLPYTPDGYDGSNKKRVREDIPVGVYDVVADFGQSRGTNTATILPNESAHARKYGRTILLRANIMRNSDLFELRRTAFAAALGEDSAADLVPDGGFYRTLWHEIGHYLGPDRTRDGRDLGDALEAEASVFEELKADLVSLFLVPQLEGRGYYVGELGRAVYASGVRRVLLKSRPRDTQVYQTMELMQLNYYLEHGLLEFDGESGHLVIHYDRYSDVISEMLERVLAIQYDGDRGAARAFIDRYTSWDENLHGRVADSMKRAETYRYAYVTYGALNPAAP